MACNNCETNFQAYQSIVVSIQKSGSNALLYLQNQGRNIVLICEDPALLHTEKRRMGNALFATAARWDLMDLPAGVS